MPTINPPARLAPHKQDDVLFPTLTVRETFEFAANIRLPAAITKNTRKQVSCRGEYRRLPAHLPWLPPVTLPMFACALPAQLVDDIISELGLGKAADTYIGNSMLRGVSGG